MELCENGTNYKKVPASKERKQHTKRQPSSSTKTIGAMKKLTGQQWTWRCLLMALVFVLTTIMADGVTLQDHEHLYHRQVLTPQEVDILLSNQHNPKHPPPPLQQNHHYAPPKVPASEALHISHTQEYEKLRQQTFDEMEHRGKDVRVDDTALIANTTNVPAGAPIAQYPTAKDPSTKSPSSPKADKGTKMPDSTPIPKETRAPKAAKGSSPPKNKESAPPKVSEPPAQNSKAASNKKTKKPKVSVPPETAAPSQQTKKPKKSPTKTPKSPKAGKKATPSITAAPSSSNTTDHMRVHSEPGFGIIGETTTETPTMENSASLTPEPIPNDDASELQDENENSGMTVINPPGLTFDGDVVERVLPWAAFHYVMTSTEVPSKETYDELSKITSTVFRDMFEAAYPASSGTGYHDTEIRGYTVFNPFLIQFNVSLYFDAQAAIPLEDDIQAVANAGLSQGQKYNEIYLARLRMFEYPIYATTTSVQFISSAAELGANKAADGSNGKSSSTESSSTTTLKKALPPIGALAGLLLLGGAVAFRYKRKNPYPTFDKDENLMKHTRDVDLESQTCASTAYRTTYFSDNGDQSTTSVYQEFARKKLGQDFEKEFSKVMDELEEVSLGSKSATSRTSASVGEISQSSEESLKSRKKVIQAKSKVIEKIENSKTTTELIAKHHEHITALAQNSKEKAADNAASKMTDDKEVKSFVAPAKSSMKKYVPEPIPPFKKSDSQGNAVSTGDTIVQVQDKHNVSEHTTPLNESLAIPTLENSGGSPSSENGTIQASTNTASSQPSSPVTKLDIVDSTSKETDYSSDSEKPTWMKQRLRAVEKKPTTPSSPSSDENGSSKPEWILKFEQMGLDKKKE